MRRMVATRAVDAIQRGITPRPAWATRPGFLLQHEARMGKPWVKLWTETLHDRKITRKPPFVRWAWCGLLMIAAQRDNDGRLELTDNQPYTDHDLADELGISDDEWTESRDYFASMDMITKDGATYILVNYVKRQESKDPSGKQRQERWRHKHVTPTVTPTQGTTVTNALRNGVGNAVISRVEVEAEVDIHTPSECGASTTSANAGPTAHATDPLSECITYLNQPKANKPGAVGRLYTIRYGARYPPDYARLGAMAKAISGGYIALAELIWRSVVPDGNPHDYLQAAVNGSPASRRTHGKPSSGTNGHDTQPVGSAQTREALERDAKILEEWIAGGSPGETGGVLPGGPPVAPDVGGA